MPAQESVITLKVQRKHIIVAAVVAVIALAGAAYVFFGNGALVTPSGAYQAITLKNGEVYFGKATNRNGATVTLTDVYFLKNDSELKNSEAGAKITLVKFENQAHGPSDRIDIPRENILYLEDLAEDSKFVKAIRAYQAGETK